MGNNEQMMDLSTLSPILPKCRILHGKTFVVPQQLELNVQHVQELLSPPLMLLNSARRKNKRDNKRALLWQVVILLLSAC
jgi:hypothetical protein